jgi:hypothetical protein
VTADELAELRSLIGTTSPPTDSDLDGIYDRVGSVRATALEVLRGRLADMRARPAEFRAEGDFSEKWSADQLKGLEADVAALAVTVEGADSVVVGRIVRGGRCR